ncbi:MAG: hypothetical protein VCA55_07365 [Verrucomicrobiales bacterium]
MAKIVPFLSLFLLLPLLTAGKRRESTLIGFHLQSGKSDPGKNTTKLMLGTTGYQVRTTPEFSQRDIDGFYPFLSEDGSTFGISFQLTKTARQRLQILSTIALGRRLFTVINNKPVDFVIIDGPIAHGYLTCWKGLQRQHVEQFKKAGFKQLEAQSTVPAAKDATQPVTSGLPR